MKIESYVRGKSLEAIKRENIKVNRALTGAALSMGAGVELSDRPGYAPEYHDPTFMKCWLRTAAWHFAEERKLSSTITAGAPVPPISAMSPA